MRNLIPAALVLILVSASGCSKFNSSASAPGAQTTQPAGGKPAGQGKGPMRAESNSKDPVAEERAKFLGTWIATDGEFQGLRTDPAGLKDMKWTFTADKVSFNMLGRAMQATYTLDPASSPKTFDFKGPETAIQGIYELKGDYLRVCYAATERPTAFATGGTSQDTLLTVFRRAKP